MNEMATGLLQRVGEHARGHRRVEQAEIDQIGVDRVEPLAGLGQHLEPRPQPIDRAGPVADLPGVGSGQQLAGQAFVVQRVGMAHGDGQVAQQPPRGPQGQEIARRRGHPLVLDRFQRPVRSQPGLDLANQVGAVGARTRAGRFLASSAWVR